MLRLQVIAQLFCKHHPAPVNQLAYRSRYSMQIGWAIAKS
jgi:hypothetical protein